MRFITIAAGLCLALAGPALAQTTASTSTAASGSTSTTAPAAAAKPAKPEKPEPVPAKHLFGYVLTPAELKPRAIGSYAKGCLAGARMLPINGDAWQVMRLSRNRNWGHPALIELLERFANDMREKEKWPGLLIGDISQPRGGPMLTGHKSHQIGLDADIWYRPMPPTEIPVAERETFEPTLLAEERGTAVIAENWNEGYVRLVRRAASYPEVERILVHPAVKKALCDAVPEGERGWLAKVRPIFLHNYHFHVRIGCPPGLNGCVGQKPTRGDDGCGKELSDWLKVVSRPPKPAPVPKPGLVPVKRNALTLDKLPPDCRRVLTYDNPAILATAAADAGKVPLPMRKPRLVLAKP